jgi:acyl-ACP thioesterase
VSVHNTGMGQTSAAAGAGPEQGRVFAAGRAVRGPDVSPDGCLRLDALARYLQEAAEGDLVDAGWGETYAWVVRRCAVEITRFPRLGQRLEVRTFCSAIGPRWAERTTTLAGARDDDGELVRARAVWAAVDSATGRPCPLGEQFHRLYAASAAGRTVSVRLSHPRPPAREDGAGDGAPWPLRATDFDASGHVNNAIYWAAAEDALAGLGWRPAGAEVEFHRAALPGCEPRLLVEPAPHGAWAWLLNGVGGPGRLLASARLARRPG